MNLWLKTDADTSTDMPMSTPGQGRGTTAEALITYLTKSLGAQMGLFYLKDGVGRLRLSGTYPTMASLTSDVRAVSVAPFVVDGEIRGIAEIGTSKELSDDQIAFLLATSERIAPMIDTDQPRICAPPPISPDEFQNN
ncbi:MAG: hypothetical protein QNJ97_15785 [Myxococcota bacterium]|nr:hypothetical protein [Myxococcota bacterium]